MAGFLVVIWGIFAFTALLMRWNAMKYRQKGLPPGTMGLPVIGETREFLKQGPNFMRRQRARGRDRVGKRESAGAPAVSRLGGTGPRWSGKAAVIGGGRPGGLRGTAASGRLRGCATARLRCGDDGGGEASDAVAEAPAAGRGPATMPAAAIPATATNDSSGGSAVRQWPWLRGGDSGQWRELLGAEDGDSDAGEGPAAAAPATR
ncbi:hypothetical protein Scep_021213 [Stephania cephalantha]|uniref:Uncharacterized protein n=1 Tax=Stephania cephalantha TaxID=152367 RepID=A0AAP0I1P7_9MAGN